MKGRLLWFVGERRNGITDDEGGAAGYAEVYYGVGSGYYEFEVYFV